MCTPSEGGNVPTYEYVCDDCGSEHEIVQAMTDPTLTECPTCGKPTLRKVFTNVGVVFKGSGFYRTDSREKPKSTSTETKKAEKADKKPAEKKSETKKAESKPKAAKKD